MDLEPSFEMTTRAPACFAAVQHDTKPGDGTSAPQFWFCKTPKFHKKSLDMGNQRVKLCKTYL
jgi:hypothetical protein